MENFLPPELWLCVLEYVSPNKVHILPSYWSNVCKLLTVEVDYRREYVSQEQLQYLFDRFRNVKVLRCKSKVETSLDCVRNCEVVEIFWSDLTNITGICDRCPNLKELSLTGIGYNYLTHKNILKGAIYLTRLSLHNFSQELLLDFQDCTEIVSVDFDKCYNITDDLLKNINDHCPKLREIRIAGTNNITDVGLTYLSGLTTFRISSNLKVSDWGMEMLVRNCPKMEIVDIKGCPQISNQTMINFYLYCNEIRAIKIC